MIFDHSASIPKHLIARMIFFLLSPTLNCSCILIIQSTPRCENNVMTSVTNMRQTYEPHHEKTCFVPYANNNDADQPAHLISAFVVRHCLDSIIAIMSKSEISRLKRAGLHVPSHVQALEMIT